MFKAFLDFEKAYDKAWLDAIMVTLWDNGIKGKIWRMVKKLNEDITTSVKTNNGLTRTIKMESCVRQRGILSVIEYAKLVDEMCKDLKEYGFGLQYEDVFISS